MKLTLVYALLSISSVAVAGVARRADPATQPKSNKARNAGEARVRGGDVVVLQGKGGRDSNNNIVIVDNSNDRKKKNDNKNQNNNDNNDFANIVVIQGQNSYTMINGRVNGQGNGVQTVTVTSTVTSVVGQQTQAPGQTSSSTTTTSSSSSSSTGTASQITVGTPAGATKAAKM